MTTYKLTQIDSITFAVVLAGIATLYALFETAFTLGNLWLNAGKALEPSNPWADFVLQDSSLLGILAHPFLVALVVFFFTLILCRIANVLLRLTGGIRLTMAVVEQDVT
jgi:hypothetical protein